MDFILDHLLLPIGVLTIVIFYKWFILPVKKEVVIIKELDEKHYQ